jgi:hypothetical protein
MKMTVNNAFEAGEANFYFTFEAMLLSFKKPEVDDAFASWLRTDGYKLVGPNPTEDDVQDVLEIGFAELYKRGAIAPCRPLSKAGAKQLEALTASHREQALAAAPIDPFSELIADNANLSASQFKQKWMLNPERLKIYESAIAAGQV